MTPEFYIRHEQTDITGRIADRLLALRITDEAGIVADQFELTLDNRDEAIAIPETGAVLEVELGYEGQPLVYMGRYSVDEIEATGMPRSLRLCGKSADMKASLKSGKKRTWSQTTIGAMVETVAAEHGLVADVAARFAQVPIDQLEQVYESDLNVLTRLAEQYGAVMKPAAGHLLFVERGAGVSASGQPLPEVFIDPDAVMDWRTSISERQHYACVWAHLRHARKAVPQYVRAGEGEPALHLRHPYISERDALAAAQAKLRHLRRGRTQLSLRMAGHAGLCAEMPIILDGFDALSDGEWIVTRAEHQLDGGGFTTAIEAQRRDDFEREDAARAEAG